MIWFKIIIFILFCFLAYLIPFQIFSSIYQLFVRISQRIKRVFEVKELVIANKLIIASTNITTFMNSDISILEYKFYTDLLLRVKKLNKIYGTPIRKYLTELRQAILRDTKFERKISGEKVKTYVQAIFLCGMLVSFMMLYRSQMHLHFSNNILYAVVLFQLLGVFITNWFYSIIKKKFFSDFTIFYKVLYTFKIRLEVGGSIQSILEDSKIDDLYYIKKTNLLHLIERLMNIVNYWRISGTSINTEVMEIITEVNFIFEDQLDKFLQAIVFLRFIVLVIFFLLPFLGINLYFFSTLFA